MKLTIDKETRSRVPLKKAGMYRYAEDESTEVMCVALKRSDQSEASLWVPPEFQRLVSDGLPLVDSRTLQSAVDRADIIEAHNAGFERAIWREVMVKRHGFEPLPFDKIRCSAAKAAALALPRALGDVCKVLSTKHQKDEEGKAAMQKMCRPRKPSKNNPNEWFEDPNEFRRLCLYCIDDVLAEESLSDMLPDLSEGELEVWRLDQIINDRGVSVDISTVKKLIAHVADKEKQLLDELFFLTDNRVSSTRQIAASVEWLEAHGIELPNLQADTVDATIAGGTVSGDPLRFLQIRRSLGKSSVSKLTAMQTMACRDGRVRGSIMYHGASTGRFTGKGVQPHNYPRKSHNEKDIGTISNLNLEEIELFFDDIHLTASKCLRGMIIGNKFISADFSAIEGRVLAWLAGEDAVLDAYRRGTDVYKLNAMEIYGVKYDTVTNKQRQVGKVAELALGYQGWVNAFASMGKNYGVEIEEEAAKEIILSWRASRVNTVRYWRNVEASAVATIKTGKPHAYGRIKFGIRGRFLHCRLPSGRLLSYCDPELKMDMTSWGEEKLSIKFMGVESTTKQWRRQTTYGGKLTENIVQAVARDLLTEAMLRVEKARYPIVFHVHDEIISEVDSPERTDLLKFIKVMSTAPEWAKGLPLNSEGWIGERYRK